MIYYRLLNMDKQVIEDQYLKINKFFGQLVGVWPYQQRFIKFCIRFITSVIVVLTLAAQISRVIMFYNIDVLSDQLPYLDIGFVLLFKQYNYILNEDKLRELLNEIISDRLIKRSKEELEILEMYLKRARVLSTIYEEKYYYPILMHMIAVALILTSVYVACDTYLVYIVHHGCALLAISGYRFKHAVDDIKLCGEDYIDSLKDETYTKVRQSIKAHKTAVEYVDKIDACHIHYFLLIIGMIVLAFTGTFVKLSSMEVNVRFFTFCVFTVGQLTHLFFLTIMGQFLINANDEIFKTIYEACWYNGSSRTQSLYVLVLRKCLSPPKLTGGGLVALNLDSFLQILKASFSYYTVFRS
ncbi:uncharacterized protein LOC102678280 isoform X2 [Apis dorsata]|uniref:uncharacterized protein LOC102678280 isoform X2 n=1 Tax=Apis dorsata TaxID=7462 RepID=UPI00129370D7|nr:uncharacterized protein LOC102678280 isoform X2 [Apis dorsata]